MAKTFRQEELYQTDIYDNLEQSLKSADKQAKKTDETFIKFHNTLAKMVETLGTSAKDVRELTAANKKSKEVLTEKQKVEANIIKIEEQLNKVTKEQRIRQQEARIELSKANKEAKEAARINKGLVTEYQKQSKQLNDLRNKYKNLVLAEGKTSKASRALLRDITKLDQRLKSVDKTVGQSQRNVGNYGSSLNKLRGTLGQLGLAFGAFALIRDSFNVIKAFDQAQADLSSVLGVTRDQMSALTQQAKELGATTEFTASQVSELQIAFAKLGFTQEEIQGVTEATLQLASAAGTDLGNAATIVGSTLRAFNLDVSNTQRLVDVMAKSFSSSSLDIDKFSSAMSNVAPAAAAIGLTIEETTALIGTLTDAGIDASSAGTGLRNMFLLAKEQGISFDEALDQIANSSDKLGTSFDLFKKKGSTLGVILANNRDATAELTETLNMSAGAAEEMADKQLDTLGGAIKLLRSAWEGIILKFSEGTGITDILKTAIQFLAENLEAIVGIILSAVKVFVVYKTTMKAATLASRAFGKSFSPKGLNIYIIALTAIVFVVMELIDAFKEAEDASNLFSRIQDEVTDKLNEEKLALEQVKEQLLLTTAGSKERQKILDETNAKYGLTLENLNDEAGFVEQVTIAYLELIDALEQRLEAQVREEFLKDLIEQRFNLNLLIKELEGTEGLFGQELLGKQALMENALTDLQDINDQILLLKDEIKGGLGVEVDVDTGECPDGFHKDASGECVPDKTTSTSKKKRKTAEEIRAQTFKDIQKQNAENLKILENNAIKSGKEQEEIDKILAERKLLNLRIENDAALRLFGEFSEEFLNANLKLNKALNVQDKEANEQQKDNKTQLFKDIQDQNAENLKILENQLIKDGVSKEERDKILAEKRLEQLENERNEALRIFGENSQQFLDADLAFNKALLSQREKADKENLERFKKNFDSLNKIAQDSAQIFIDSLDRKIEAGKEEVQASQDEQARLQDLQAQGVEGAAEALVAEKQREAREKLNIEALEKKKRDLLITLVALERANQLIQAGDGNPFKNAGQGITEFIGSLKGLYGGTETTVGNEFGAPHLNTGKDQYIARLDKKEMVLKPGYVDKLQAAGFRTTADVTRAALLSQNQALYNPLLMAKSDPNNNAKLIGEIQKNTEAIQNIRIVQQHIDLFKGVEIIRDGNTITKNTVKKPGLTFGG